MSHRAKAVKLHDYRWDPDEGWEFLIDRSLNMTPMRPGSKNQTFKQWARPREKILKRIFRGRIPNNDYQAEAMYNLHFGRGETYYAPLSLFSREIEEEKRDKKRKKQNKKDGNMEITIDVDCADDKPNVATARKNIRIALKEAVEVGKFVEVESQKGENGKITDKLVPATGIGFTITEFDPKEEGGTLVLKAKKDYFKSRDKSKPVVNDATDQNLETLAEVLCGVADIDWVGNIKVD